MVTMTNKVYYLTEFKVNDPEWYIVNDGVMGGLSESQIVTEEDKAIFSGNVSLKNNGGFASVRMPIKEQLPSNFNKVIIRLKGDGKQYQFRLRKENDFDGLAYDYGFSTPKGQWEKIEIPLSEVVGTFRGRKFPDKTGVSSDEIQQIGILIADKQEGSFQLELDYIALSE